VNCSVFLADLQTAIEEETKCLKTGENADFFDSYHSYEEIVAWMTQMQAKYSFLYMVPVGKTTQGTPIWGIEMNGGPGRRKRDGEMPNIYFHGAQHAREWIAPATVCYILNSLAENYGTNGTITKIVDEINWSFVPVVNVDGYNYSRVVDRMWRKNRRPPPQGSSCWGVDINRNWPFRWDGQGSSNNPCSETYMGPGAGSEEEVQSVSSYINTLTNLVVATDWHSYGQLYLIPWGWTTQKAPTNEEMMNMGTRFAAAIRSVDNQIYRVGSTSELLYITTGSFRDWSYGVQNIKYSTTIELRDTGRYGFLLPASEIIPTGKENFNGVVMQASSILESQN